MLVKKIYDAYDLEEEFKRMNRNPFTHEGYQALIELFNEFDEPQELDVIAICCEFTEATPADIMHDYGYTIDGMDYDDALATGDYDEDEIIDVFVGDYLNYHTWAVALSNGHILYQNF